MGLAIRPPDINYSQANFSVEANDIVYGLLGIKGWGRESPRAIVEERKSGGSFSGFVDFLARMSEAGLNKKILESLIHAGCFDSLACKRKELMFNLERAIDWVAAKLDHESSRQQMPFRYRRRNCIPSSGDGTSRSTAAGDAGFREKASWGFYFTGHPMDDFKTLWERSSTHRS
jgi:DNA polymerase-3 subunit alpha